MTSDPDPTTAATTPTVPEADAEPVRGRIVVGVDDSADSDRAVDWAAATATTYHARLHLLYALRATYDMPLRDWDEQGFAEEVLAQVGASGLAVACVGVELGWMFAEGAERRRLLAAFTESCAWAAALRCSRVMSPVDRGQGDLARAAASIACAAASSA